MHVITDSNCAEGEYSDLDFLEAFWVNDQEVAAYLNQTYGMPASYAEFQVTEKRDGPALTTTWTFGPPGRTPSLLEAVNPSDIPEAWTAGINRLSWINQFGGITYLDYEQEEFYTSPNPLVTGKLRPPLPYTTTEAEDFVGTGRPVWGVEGSGAFHQFRDLACDEPL